MHEHNRLRLSRMAARWDRQRAARGDGDAEREAERAAAFYRELGRVKREVLHPVIAAIGAELARAGHGHRVEESEDPPRFDLYLQIRGRSGSKDLIQLVVREDPERGREVIAELVLKRSPVELARYGWPSDITVEVAEQLLVDAIEHVFASPAT